jgi:hypothetical protein
LVIRLGHRVVIVTGVLPLATGGLILGTQVTPTPSCLAVWLPLQIIGGAEIKSLLVGCLALRLPDFNRPQLSAEYTNSRPPDGFHSDDRAARH